MSDCAFPGCRSGAIHNPFDTHFLCACGWVGYVHSRHVSCLTAVRLGGRQGIPDAAARVLHRIVARQRLRRLPLRVVQPPVVTRIAIAKALDTTHDSLFSVDEVVA